MENSVKFLLVYYMKKRELLWKKESLVIRSSAILLESYQ